MRKLIVIAFMYCGCSIHSSNVSKITSVDSLVKLATIADSLRDLPSSISYYNRILEIDSTKLIALLNRGRDYVYSKQAEKGISDYDKAVKYYPCASTFFARGIGYTIIGNYNRAFQDFLIAKTYDSNYAKAYYGLSVVELNHNRLNSAARLCHKADSLKYDAGLSEYIKAQIKKNKGDTLSKD